MNMTSTLAKRSLKKNLSKTILIGISVFLTTVLLSVIAFGCYGIISSNRQGAGKLYGKYQAIFLGIKEEQWNTLQADGEILKAGRSAAIGSVSLKKASATLSYYDTDAREMANMEFQTGKYPERVNEIAGQKEFFHSLGYSDPVIGMTVKIPYRVNDTGKIREQEFKISGLLPSNQINDLQKTYGTLVSKKFYETVIPKEQRVYSVSVELYQKETLNYEEMKQKATEAAKRFGVSSDHISFNLPYIMWSTDPGTETIAAGLGIAFMVILFSIVVIYNIFYVGIIQRVQEYGKLHAIGMTKKQMKRMLLKEGMVISVFSIPLGILAGLGITKILVLAMMEAAQEQTKQVFEGISVFHPLICVGIILIALLTVYLSLKKPMKIASKISPVEAVKYQETLGSRRNHRKGYHSLNVFRLTKSNLMRNKKRTITTILTMGLSCVMFVTIANVCSSMDPDYEAKKDFPYGGQFAITLNTELDDETYPEKNFENVQELNLLGSDIVREIKNIKGVTKVEVRKQIAAEIVEGKSERTVIFEVLSKSEFEKELKKMDLGSADYQKAVEENGVIYNWKSFMEENGYHVGQSMNFSFKDGKREIPMKGVLLGAGINNRAGSFMMTEEMFQKLGVRGSKNSEIFVSCQDQAKESVENRLNELTANSEFYALNSYDNSYDTVNFFIYTMRVACYSFLAVLGMIGFMNMANTLITSTITRKREFGVLQAIGLTTKQLNHMLQLEGLIFTVGTLFISLTVGNILGYALFRYCKETGIIGLESYHFPAAEVAFMAIGLLVMQGLLSWFMSKNLQKDSLIERIRYEE